MLNPHTVKVFEPRHSIRSKGIYCY